MQKQNNLMEWLVVASMNGETCSVCGKKSNEFQAGTCWFNTYGLFRFGHPEFEMVVQLSPIRMAKILNVLGLLVSVGQKFEEGGTITIEGIDKEFHLKEFCLDGQKYLRLIVPDNNGLYPEDEGCEYPFSMQLKSIDELCSKGECECSRKSVGEALDTKRRVGYVVRRT